MCIIMIKPRSVELPTLEVFENCWSHNDDGAGFMYAADGVVKGSKGYADVAALYAAVSGTPGLIDRAVVVHFRVATHGARDNTATHPFPISQSVDDLKALDWKAPLGLAHNGILSNYGGKAHDELSDTQDFIRTVLGRRDVTPHITKKYFRHLWDGITGSNKFALMDLFGRVYLIGDFVESGNVFYSNTTYKTRWAVQSYKTYRAGSCYSGYAWNDVYGPDGTYDYGNRGRWVKGRNGWFQTFDPESITESDRLATAEEVKDIPEADDYDYEDLGDCMYTKAKADTFCMYLNHDGRDCYSCHHAVDTGDEDNPLLCTLSPEYYTYNEEAEKAAEKAYRAELAEREGIYPF